MNDKDDFIVALLQVDEGIKYDYEQTHKATRGHLSGEKLLMMAVLADALDTVRGKPRAGLHIRRERCAESQTQFKRNRRRHVQDAWRWFACDDDWDTFSFVNICGHLKLDPQAVRKAVANGDKKATVRKRA